MSDAGATGFPDDIDISEPLPELPTLPHFAIGGPRPAGQADLDRYEVLGELGRGGMGVVERARDREIGRDIAVKRLLSDGPGKEALGRFMEEAQITGQLEHPNICPVHELGLDRSGRLYFTMKLVKGRSLGERIEVAEKVRARGIPIDEFPGVERLEVFRKICDAVAYAHDRGVVHRDLKPANVMVGEYGEVLVMDWGLAKILDRKDEEALPDPVRSDRREGGVGLSIAGRVSGTPNYMSPEQARGETDRVDERSDVYSLGAILYELLTHTAPYVGDGSETILMRVASGHLEPPSTRVRRLPGPKLEVPRELEAIVLKAMHSNPNRRYWTVGALRADLDNYMSGRLVRAADYSPLEMARRWASRNRALAAGAVAAAVSILAGVVGFVWIQAASLARRREAEISAAVAREAATRKGKEEAEAKRLAERRHEARERYARGRVLLSSAAVVPFRSGAPHDWFQVHLTALLSMGRALLTHPSPSPEAWRTEVAEATAAVQARAEEVGSWALAEHAARLAGMWGAIPAREARERIERLRESRRGRIARDLEEFERISEDLGKSRLRGLIREQALRIARLENRGEIARKTLADLLSTGTSPLERCFLVEALGYLDPRAEHEGIAAVDLVGRTLSGNVARIPLDELEAWLSTAVRLEAANPGLFREPDLTGRLEEVARACAGSDLRTRAVARARRQFESLIGRAAIPDPTLEPEGYEAMSRELGEWLAGSVRSRPAHARRLVELAGTEARDDDGRALTPRQQAFVLEQLGNFGDLESSDPDRPHLSPLAILRRTLAEAPDEALRPDASPGAEAALRRAIAAANALARLRDAGSAPVFFARRRGAGHVSLFYWRTRVAASIFPVGEWNEPDDAAGFLARAEAHVAQGRPGPAENDLRRAVQLEPGDPEVLDALASFLAGRARGHWRVVAAALAGGDERTAAERDEKFVATAREALALWARAIEASPADARLFLHRGEFLLQTHPDDPRPPGDAGRQELARDWRRTATEDLRRAHELASSADRDPTYGRAGAFHGVESGGAEGLRLLEAAVARNPNLVEAWYFLGVLRGADGVESLTRAIEIDPLHEPAYRARIDLRRKGGELARAVEDATTLLEIDPSNLETRVLRGELRLAQGDSGASEDFLQVLSKIPRHPICHQGMGVLLARQGRLDESRQAFLTALRVRRSDCADWTATKRLMYETHGDRAEPFFFSQLSKAPQGLAPVPAVLVPGRYRSPWEHGRPGTYRLDGTAGQRIRLAVLSGTGDPEVEIVGPGGRWRASNDDRDCGLTDAEIRTVLPADGTYTIEIRALPHGRGKAYVVEFEIE